MEYELKDKELKDKIELDDKDFMLYEMLLKIFASIEKMRHSK